MILSLEFDTLHGKLADLIPPSGIFGSDAVGGPASAWSILAGILDAHSRRPEAEMEKYI